MIKYFNDIYFTSGAVVAFTVFTLTTIGSTNALSDLMYKSIALTFRYPLVFGGKKYSCGSVCSCVCRFPQVHLSVFFFLKYPTDACSEIHFMFFSKATTQ